MEQKRVYKQSELMKLLSVSRDRIKFMMYDRGIVLKTQYCPYSKKIKSGYLIDLGSIDNYRKELSMLKSDKLKFFLLVQNNDSKMNSLIKIESKSIMFGISNCTPIFFIETNFVDLDLLFNENLTNYKTITVDELSLKMSELGILHKQL